MNGADIITKLRYGWDFAESDCELRIMQDFVDPTILPTDANSNILRRWRARRQRRDR
jgi:hypothetical protein